VTEAEFIAALRALPLHRGALDLRDDAARIGDLVLTTDMIAEGVHFLASDPPGDVAWKLVAVNLSDLAAKGAVPEGIMLGYPLGDEAWDAAFLDGLGAALTAFDCPLLGGDTIRTAGARTFAITAIGRAAVAPSRGGARIGDRLWVTGTIGDAGIGLAIAQGADGPAELLARYRRPVPRLAEGRALAPVATAMMDISDGLLIDAERMADASGCGVTIELGAVPLAPLHPGDRIAAVTAGDDYELLFALPDGVSPPVAATRIGRFAPEPGLRLTSAGAPFALPDRLGYQHG